MTYSCLPRACCVFVQQKQRDEHRVKHTQVGLLKKLKIISAFVKLHLLLFTSFFRADTDAVYNFVRAVVDL